jgi:hypothetical protein
VEHGYFGVFLESLAWSIGPLFVLHGLGLLPQTKTKATQPKRFDTSHFSLAGVLSESLYQHSTDKEVLGSAFFSHDFASFSAFAAFSHLWVLLKWLRR